MTGAHRWAIKWWALSSEGSGTSMIRWWALTWVINSGWQTLMMVLKSDMTMIMVKREGKHPQWKFKLHSHMGDKYHFWCTLLFFIPASLPGGIPHYEVFCSSSSSSLSLMLMSTLVEPYPCQSIWRDSWWSPLLINWRFITHGAYFKSQCIMQSHILNITHHLE